MSHQELLDRMIDLKLLQKGEDSTDGSPIVTLTSNFEKFLLQSKDALLSEKEQADMLIMGLIIQTGSLDTARLYFISTIIAEYLNFSETETTRMQPELMRYADALLQLGQHMKFLQDWK